MSSRQTGPRPWRAVGDSAVLIETPEHRAAGALAAVIRERSPQGLVEVVPGLRSVLVVLDPERAATDGLAEELAGTDADPARAPGRTVTLPIALDGPDLPEVTERTGLGRDDLARLLAASTLEVAMVGFSPGFAYLVGLPKPLDGLPRRANPRTKVPAGSLGLAGGFAGIYPRATPGGWQLVGRTSETMFDPEHHPYVRLQAGDQVRFVEAGEMARPSETAPRTPLEAPGKPAWLVMDPGLLTTVQDAGRVGFAHLGVPAAGPADDLAQGLANGLVGNPPGAPALELTARGPVLRSLTSGHLALVGQGGPSPPDGPLVLLDGHPIPSAAVVPVAAGQELAIRTAGAGLRAYLAVAGGFASSSVLGSQAMDLLGGLGGGPLEAGDQLGRLEPPGRLGGLLSPPAPPSHRRRGRCRLRVLPGPHREWFGQAALRTLVGQTFRIESGSDRTGIRLVSERGSIERRPGELDSQGMVRGAVQVPPDGQPVVLGPDHATHGGYPVLAVVISADHWRLGQCGPGAEVDFELVDLAQARQAWREHRVARSATVGHYPAGVETS